MFAFIVAVNAAGWGIFVLYVLPHLVAGFGINLPASASPACSSWSGRWR
jgi:hypothetical protein